MRDSVRVRVPATIANLGAGFDCLGLSVALHNEVSMAIGHGPTTHVAVAGEGCGALPEDATNLVAESARQAFEEAGRECPPLRIACVNRIALARGMGSSSAAIVGGIVAANELMGRPLPPDAVLHLATRIEGHPDNVAPALLGGLVLTVEEAGHVQAVPVASPHLARVTCVLAVPELRVSTEAARQVLPREVPMADAVYNAARTALWLHAIHSGDLTLLREAARDRLHQPYRAHLIPGVADVFDAGARAGALAVFVAGSGPSVCALCESGADAAGRAMVAAFEASGVEAWCASLAVSPVGAECL